MSETVYVKGDKVRVARTPAQAVQAQFDGFKVAEGQEQSAPEETGKTPAQPVVSKAVVSQPSSSTPLPSSLVANPS